MNTICSVRKEYGGWLVEAVTPEGMHVRTYRNTLGQAMQEALYTEGEPA